MADIFVTLAEVKTYLNITDTTKDALITALIEPMTDTILSMLCVTDLSEHVTEDERVEVYEYNRFYLNEFPVDTDSTITIKDLDGNELTGYTFKKDPGELRRLYIYDESGVRTTICYDKILVTYTAGYAYTDDDDNEVPEVFKLAMSLLVSGATADSDRVAEYEILDKRVKFKSSGDYNTFMTVMDKYISQYKNKIAILS